MIHLVALGDNEQLNLHHLAHRQLVRQDSTMSGEHALYFFGSHFTAEHYKCIHILGHLFVRQIYHRN